MYQLSKVSQAPSSIKSPVQKGFYQSKYKKCSPDLRKDPIKYVNSLRGFGKAIYLQLFKNHNLKFNKQKNVTIAKAVGCDTRTVQRWTAKLEKEGIIFKERPTISTPNSYTFNTPKSVAFQLWFNGLTAKQQDAYNTHGIVIDEQSVVRSYSLTLVLNPSLLLNPIPIARARAKVGQRLSQQRKESKEYIYFKLGVEALREEAKEWVLKHPDSQEILQASKSESYLISPTMKQIADLLKLTQLETFKLLAFSDEALKFSLGMAQEVLEGKRVPAKPIMDGFAWFQAVAKRWSEENGLLPDWRLYYEVCKAKGLNSGTKSIPQPLKGKAKAKTTQGHSPMGHRVQVDKVAEWTKSRQTWTTEQRAFVKKTLGTYDPGLWNMTDGELAECRALVEAGIVMDSP